MSKWVRCLFRWSRLHAVRESWLNRRRFGYPPADAGRSLAPLETMEPRMLFSSSVLGNVFADGDRDGARSAIEPAAYEKQRSIDTSARIVSTGRFDSAATTPPALGQEKPLSGWSVYLDENLDGQYNRGEQVTQTDAQGNFRFDDLPEGIHDIGLILEDGWRFTEGVNPLQTVSIDGKAKDAVVSFAMTRDVEATIDVETQSNPELPPSK